MAAMALSSLGQATRADLDRMPEDGNRYELLAGEIVVSPAPTPRHQLIVTELLYLLRQSCPSGLLVSQAPFDVELEPGTVVEPDLLVFSPEQLDDRGVIGAPLLAVEVLSPGTRMRDLRRKKTLYERAGVTSYWVVDPVGDIAFTAWELRDGGYQAVASVAGDEGWTADLPYRVDVVPARLIR